MEQYGEYVVDVLFKQLNWWMSVFALTSPISQVTTKTSSTFDKHEVRDIGVVSPSLSGPCAFGIGMMSDSLQPLARRQRKEMH